jgi:hypothetical protein
MTCALVPAALFTLGFLKPASADVVDLHNFDVTLSGNPVFTDSFSTGTLSGGSGTVLPAGPTYSDGSTALYQVIGTLQETGTPPATKAVLDSAQGALLAQSSPGFFSSIHLNAVTLLTGPPGSPFSLTQTSSFTTSGLYDVTMPATPGGFYQIDLSDRAPSNSFLGDVLGMAVANCTTPAAACGLPPGSAPGPYIGLSAANAFAGTTEAIASVPLDTSNQQILLELTKPDPTSDTIEGEYEYFNNGIGSGLHVLGSYSGLFTGPGTLDDTEAGLAQLAPVPAPEPSSLALLASSVLGLVWLRRRKADGDRSKIETHT